jgi:hypothetical protein
MLCRYSNPKRVIRDAPGWYGSDEGDDIEDDASPEPHRESDDHDTDVAKEW